MKISLSFASSNCSRYDVVRLLFFRERMTPGTVHFFFLDGGASGGGPVFGWKGERLIARDASAVACVKTDCRKASHSSFSPDDGGGGPLVG